MTETAAPSKHSTDGFGVSSRIQAALPEMSAAMAKIGALLLENPAAPLELSITELAQQAGTSPATVTRFCRLIGYAGYPPLRVGAAADLGRSSAETWQSDIGRAFDPADSVVEVLNALVSSHTSALQTTAARLDREAAERAAAAIARSDHVDIYGIGGSAVLAAELQARLYRIGLNAHMWSEVHEGLTSAAIQGPGTVAIGISNTGRTGETLEMLSLARSTGALAVAITGNPDSPLASVADYHLTAFAADAYLQPDDLSAKHAQLLAIDLLYLLVAQQDFSRTTAKLAASAAAVAPHRRSLRGSGRTAAKGRTAS
ncbi:MurR/RpiR family transcriptional regulator [Gryllotalpicola koreensis]|uniref:MurR/RpiR family transcriptional regulator n=1 Tax=Gryllotalpicola koreensis TaxID=993086 RepID=A0ABP7ZZT2_9MICO